MRNVLKPVVRMVQAVAVMGAVAFLVLLFANEPAGVTLEDTNPAENEPDGEPAAGADVDAAALFADRCGSCHGVDGGGGIGPQLSDGEAASRFPDIEDQVAVVTGGRGGMPAFGTRLSEDEIRVVVRYSRTL